MTTVVFGEVHLAALLKAAESPLEIGAAVFLRHDPVADRYLVNEVRLAEGANALSASPTEFTFAPQFLTQVTRIARDRQLHLALLHSHPSGFTNFSCVDDETEGGLSTFMAERMRGAMTFSILICGEYLRARQFGTGIAVPVVCVGNRVVRHANHPSNLREPAAQFDRQVRAFGIDGQQVLERLKVAIVGLGGTGSVMTQQLAHLGVGSFLLIDDDHLDTTNLNRVAGASTADVGRPKVEIAARLIAHISPVAKVTSIGESVVSAKCAELLRVIDCIFICTDSHVSRAFLSEFAHQYLIPAFDVGVSISAKDGRVEAITGRTQMLAPGLACLSCGHVLDAQQIREELMTPEQRAADPYFNSKEGVHQPAVMSLNSAMVSLTVTMFMSAFLGIPGRARWQSYDGLAGTVRVLASRRSPDCEVCGDDGVTALGNSRSLTFLGESI